MTPASFIFLSPSTEGTCKGGILFLVLILLALTLALALEELLSCGVQDDPRYLMNQCKATNRAPSSYKINTVYMKKRDLFLMNKMDLQFRKSLFI